jgi:hypothetical protein
LLCFKDLGVDDGSLPDHEGRGERVKERRKDGMANKGLLLHVFVVHLKAEMVECYYDAFGRLDNQVFMEALVHQGFIFKEVCSVYV